MSKRLVIDLSKYVLAVGLLVYVVWAYWGTPGSNGLGDVWQRHVMDREPIHFGFFLAAFLLLLCGFSLTLIRWYYLVRAQDLPFTMPDAVRIGLIGYFFNTFLPGSVGGDIIKAAFLAREQSRRTVAVATVIMDRVIALWALVWFVAILGVIFWLTGSLEGESAETSKLVVILAGVIVVVSLVVWGLMGWLPPSAVERFTGRLERIPKVGVSAAEFWRATWMYRSQQASVYLTIVLSWMGHVCFVIAFFCAAHVLWDSRYGIAAIPGLVQHFLLVPIGLVAQAVIPLPGGMGIGEISFGGLYEAFGGSAKFGVLMSLVQRVITWVLGFTGYIVYLRLRTRLHSVQLGKDPMENPIAAPVAATIGEG